MTVYMIYLDPSLNNPGYNGQDWDLYAITNRKKIYKDFISTRNMKVFKVDKKKFTKDQYEQLSKEYRGSVLQITALSTKEKYPTSRMENFGKCIVDYKLVTTYFEYQSVQEVIDNPYALFENLNMVNPILFSKDIRDMLKQLRYDQIYKMTVLPHLGMDSFMLESDECLENTNLSDIDRYFIIESEDISLPDIWTDELMVFIRIFGNLLEINK